MKKVNFEEIQFEFNGNIFVINESDIHKKFLLNRAVRQKLRAKIIHFLIKGEIVGKKLLLTDEIREKANGTYEMSVSALYVNLGTEQSVMSQMLAILQNEGIVEESREGKNIFHYLNLEILQKIAQLKVEWV